MIIATRDSLMSEKQFKKQSNEAFGNTTDAFEYQASHYRQTDEDDYCESEKQFKKQINESFGITTAVMASLYIS